MPRDFSNLTRKLNLIEYYNWRASWTYNEDSGYEAYMDEDRAKREILNPTSEEDQGWQQLKAADAGVDF